jgi:hypothetical protein
MIRRYGRMSMILSRTGDVWLSNKEKFIAAGIEVIKLYAR